MEVVVVGVVGHGIHDRDVRVHHGHVLHDLYRDLDLFEETETRLKHYMQMLFTCLILYEKLFKELPVTWGKAVFFSCGLWFLHLQQIPCLDF